MGSSLFSTLQLTAPIFLLMAVGYVAVRSKYFPAEGIGGLSAFVAKIAVPVLIFRALAERDIAEIFNLPYLLAYTLASLLPFAAAFIYAKKLREQDNVSAAFYGMGSSFSNSVMVGLPIVTALFGEAALVPFALTLLVENLVMMPMTLAIADSAKREQSSFIGRALGTLPTIARNPIVVAICLGVIASLIKLPIPNVGSKLMELLAASVTGAALFAVGGMLVGLRVGTLLKDLSVIAGCKLILHPLAAVAAFTLIPGIAPEHAKVAILLACSPMFGIYAVIGAQYGKGQFCAAAMLPTTVFSFITISVALAFMLAES